MNAMSTCGLIHAALMKTGKMYVAESEEAEFMKRCHEFALQCVLALRPSCNSTMPCPVLHHAAIFGVLSFASMHCGQCAFPAFLRRVENSQNIWGGCLMLWLPNAGHSRVDGVREGDLRAMRIVGAGIAVETIHPSHGGTSNPSG